MNDDHGELPYWKQDIMRKNTFFAITIIVVVVVVVVVIVVR